MSSSLPAMFSGARETSRSPAWTLARAFAMVPVLFVVALGAAVALGVLSAVLGLHPLTGPWGGRLFVLLLVMAVVAAARHVWTRRVLLPTTRFPLAPTLPGLALIGYAAASRLLSPGHRAEWFLGGDHVRHLIFVVEEREAGNLTYASQPYPRAWHTLVTALWTSADARPNAAGLRSLVDLMATVTWCLPGVLSIATGVLAVELARRWEMPDSVASLAGLGAAAMVLWPPFLSNYQVLGFENSMVGAIVLAVAAREVAVRDGSWSAFVALVGIVVCAHTWQLLLPAIGVAFLFLAWRPVRSGGWRSRGALVGSCIAAAAAAMPALLAVFTVVGIQHASDSEVEAPLPVALLVAGIASSTALLLRHRGRSPLTAVWLVSLLPGLTAITVAARLGIGITQYYPSKLLWHSAVLGLAPLAGVVVGGWWRLGQRLPGFIARIFAPVGVAVGVLALAFALITPAGAFFGAWSTVRGSVVLDAVTSPGAERAQVVWLGGIRQDDTIGRILLDFYRAGETVERTPQHPLDVLEECDLLQAVDQPAVLSIRPAESVRTRFGCATKLEVVPADIG